MKRLKLILPTLLLASCAATQPGNELVLGEKRDLNTPPTQEQIEKQEVVPLDLATLPPVAQDAIKIVFPETTELVVTERHNLASNASPIMPLEATKKEDGGIDWLGWLEPVAGVLTANPGTSIFGTVFSVILLAFKRSRKHAIEATKNAASLDPLATVTSIAKAVKSLVPEKKVETEWVLKDKESEDPKKEPING